MKIYSPSKFLRNKLKSLSPSKTFRNRTKILNTTEKQKKILINRKLPKLKIDDKKVDKVAVFMDQPAYLRKCNDTHIQFLDDLTTKVNDAKASRFEGFNSPTKLKKKMKETCENNYLR